MAQSYLRQIGIALNNYDATHKRMPPAASHDQNGKPLLSWRVLILPFIDHDELYAQFHLDESWDSPHNLSLLPRMPPEYRAMYYLDDEPNPKQSSTFTQAVTGKGTAFDGLEGLSLAADFRNTSNTIVVVEAGKPVPWTKPEDLVYDDDQPLPPLGGVFTGKGRFSLSGPSRAKGFNVLFADGHVEFLPSPIDQSNLRRAFHRDSDRPLDGLE